MTGRHPVGAPGRRAELTDITLTPSPSTGRTGAREGYDTASYVKHAEQRACLPYARAMEVLLAPPCRVTSVRNARGLWVRLRLQPGLDGLE